MLLQSTATRAQPAVPHVPSDKLQEKYTNALVFFQDPNDAENPSRGYGVVVSEQGHVLTVGHVVALFNGATIRGSIGRPKSGLRELTVVAGEAAIGAESPGLVLLELKDKKGIVRTPLARKDPIKTGAKLRALTGAYAADTTSVVEVEVATPLGDMYQLSSKGLDTGNSGSPIFDHWGFVVGLVEQGKAGGGTSNAQSTLGAQKFAGTFEPQLAPESISRFKVFIGSLDGNSNDPVMDYRDILMLEFHRLAEGLQVRRDFTAEHQESKLLQRLFISFQTGDNPANQLAAAQNELASKEAALRSEIEKIERGRLYLLLLRLKFLNPSPLSGTGRLLAYPVVVVLDRSDAQITMSAWDPIRMDPIPYSTAEEVAKTVVRKALEKIASREQRFTRDMLFLDCVDDPVGSIGSQITTKLHKALTDYWKKEANTPFHRYESKIAAARQEICEKKPSERETEQDDSYIYSLARESIKAELKPDGRGKVIRRWRIRMPNGSSPPLAADPETPDLVRSDNYIGIWVEDITNRWFEGRPQ